MPGSATGEEAIALLKANNDGKAFATAAAAAKKEDAVAKKAQDTSSRVIALARSLLTTSRRTGRHLRNLRVDDYYSLMVHATPHVTVKKPKSKKDGYDKACELPTVRSALDFFSATAPPPPQMHIPPPPRFSEHENRISIHRCSCLFRFNFYRSLTDRYLGACRFDTRRHRYGVSLVFFV